MKANYLLIVFMLVFAACKPKEGATATEKKDSLKKKILTGATITAVKIEQFPRYTKSGEMWDAYATFAADPDLFVRIKWNDNVIYKSETREDCPHGTPVPFSVGIPVHIKPFDQPLLIEVFDEDAVSSNDNMAYFTLKLTDYKCKKQIKLEDATKELVLLLDMEWVY